MVFTPLHYPQAYLLYRFSKGFSYPGLLIGSFLPDLEIPVLFLLGYQYPYTRLVLHSFLGALAFSWILGLALLPLYKVLIHRILGIKPLINTVKYLVSVTVGALLHVLVDGFHHIYNPLLWPLTSSNIDVLVFTSQPIAHIVMHIIFLVLTILSLAMILVETKVWGIKDLLTKILYDPCLLDSAR
ncbi:MAG: metal-dependent hydrolase [Desulfurococcales archaeon]|nr:metal-dependent hydrolase [Desulfurococcales archaeon]